MTQTGHPPEYACPLLNTKHQHVLVCLRLLTFYYSGYAILLRCTEVKEENTEPNETNDEMEPRRSGKSAAQKARDLHRSAGT